MVATLDMVTDEGDIKWTETRFPDGHRHINLGNNKAVLEACETVDILMRLKNGNDIFELKQIVNAVRYINPKMELNLFIPYLLAGRYDRRMYECDSEDLKIVCSDINALNFNQVGVVEPHSVVTDVLLDNLRVVHPMEEHLTEYIKSLDNQEDLVIFAPDMGAVKRTEQFIVNSGLNLPMGIIHKQRNLLTGKILGMKVVESPRLEGKTVILYDDLCDGGKTFTSASHLLKKTWGAKRVELAVTHGVFSKGYDALFNDENGSIDYIITTDSYQKQAEHPKVKIVSFL